MATSVHENIVASVDANHDGKKDLDSNQDGVVTHAELKEQAPLLAEMDTNLDGAVSMGEVMDATNSVVNALDTNDDGKVSVVELNQGAANLMAVVDTNNDGQVSPAELAADHAELDKNLNGVVNLAPKPASDATFQAEFATCDKNGDGYWNLTEFGKCYISTLPITPQTSNEADNNGDGKISPAEFKETSTETTEDQITALVVGHGKELVLVTGCSGSVRSSGWSFWLSAAGIIGALSVVGFLLQVQGNTSEQAALADRPSLRSTHSPLTAAHKTGAKSPRSTPRGHAYAKTR